MYISNIGTLRLNYRFRKINFDFDSVREKEK